jgi:hypothetical protein
MISNIGTEKCTFKRPTPSWGRRQMYEWDGAKNARCRLVGKRIG